MLQGANVSLKYLFGIGWQKVPKYHITFHKLGLHTVKVCTYMIRKSADVFQSKQTQET